MSDLPQTQTDVVNQTYLSHLVELRRRLVRAGTALFVAFVGLVYWAPDIFPLLARPVANSEKVLTLKNLNGAIKDGTQMFD